MTKQLTNEQKDYIEQMAINKVNDMNNDQFLIDSIHDEIDKMDEHLRDYFYKIFHHHSKQKK